MFTPPTERLRTCLNTFPFRDIFIPSLDIGQIFPQILTFPDLDKHGHIRDMKKVGHGEGITTDVFMLSEDLIVNLKNTDELSALSFNDLLVRNVIRIPKPN